MRGLTFGVQRLYYRLRTVGKFEFPVIPIVKFGALAVATTPCQFVYDDAVRRGEPHRWEVMTDHLLGGYSTAMVSHPSKGQMGTARFEGKISLEVPEIKYVDRSGFAGIYNRKCDLDLEGYTAFIVRCRTSIERPYYFQIMTFTTFTPEGNVQRAAFSPPSNGEWHDIRIPFLSFNLWIGGQRIKSMSYPNLTQVKGLAVVTEGYAGEFRLEIDSIFVDRDEEEDFFNQDVLVHPLTPKRVLSFPHVGITRQRVFMTSRLRRIQRRIISRYLPFIWDPNRLKELAESETDHHREKLYLSPPAFQGYKYEPPATGPRDQVIGNVIGETPHAPSSKPPKVTPTPSSSDDMPNTSIPNQDSEAPPSAAATPASPPSSETSTTSRELTTTGPSIGGRKLQVFSSRSSKRRPDEPEQPPHDAPEPNDEQTPRSR